MNKPTCALLDTQPKDYVEKDEYKVRAKTRTDAVIYPTKARDIVTGEEIEVVHVSDCRVIELKLRIALKQVDVLLSSSS